MEAMSSSHNAATGEPVITFGRSETFAPLSARRLLVLGGIGLILAGMFFGDIFAVFVLHQNAARVGANLAGAAHAALLGDASAVQRYFQGVSAFLENHGTKVDTHVHMIDFGYLALLLALAEPWIALSPRTKLALAWAFLAGAGILPVGVFLIHYVGLVYSPFEAIGWASVAADFGGLLVLVASLGCLAGLWRHFRSGSAVTDELLACTADRSRQALLAGGVVLILLGFLCGAYYAGVELYKHEARDVTDLSGMAGAAAARNASAVDKALMDYGQLQGEKAVQIAAHAHAIEFGLLAMMLAFFQPYVGFREKWKYRWALTLLAGSLALPVFVLLELKYGLLAGAAADLGGLLVIIALSAMWIGILRHSGAADAVSRQASGGAS
jgi:hypothetical protein